jgi:hypothetical protein
VTLKRIAVIDDDSHIRQILAAARDDEGYKSARV